MLREAMVPVLCVVAGGVFLLLAMGVTAGGAPSPSGTRRGGETFIQLHHGDRRSLQTSDVSYDCCPPDVWVYYHSTNPDMTISTLCGALASNQLCLADRMPRACGGTCVDLCAPSCMPSHLNNTVCDPNCNVRACRYDNGGCSPCRDTTALWDAIEADPRSGAQWGAGAMGWSRNTDPCTGWQGIQCNNNGYVIAIDLHERYSLGYELTARIGDLVRLRDVDLRSTLLSGTIPNAVGMVRTLVSLQVSSTALSGTFPQNLMLLPRLQVAAFSATSLSGTLPAVVGNTTDLRDVSWRYTAISGTLPETVGNMKNLTSLSVSSTMISGTIPPAVATLSGLEALYTYASLVSGTLPHVTSATRFQVLRLHRSPISGTFAAWFTSLPAIYDLEVQQTMLSGTLPHNIGDLLQLETLDAGSTRLSGTLPTTVVRLVSLATMNLEESELSGTMPANISHALALESLWLGGTPISGTVPSDLGRLPNLQNVILDTPRISGTVPSSVGDLPTLLQIVMQGASLSGTLPKSFWKSAYLQGVAFASTLLSGTLPSSIGSGIASQGGIASQMQALFMPRTRLSGTVPTSIGDMYSLEELDLSRCRLSGTLPDSIALLRVIHYFFLHENRISGSLPMSLSTAKFLGGAAYFRVDGNLLTAIPESLSNCVGLSALDISRNQITRLPPVLPSSLSHLFFSQNPLNDTAENAGRLLIASPQLRSVDIGFVNSPLLLESPFWYDSDKECLLTSYDPNIPPPECYGARVKRASTCRIAEECVGAFVLEMFDAHDQPIRVGGLIDGLRLGYGCIANLTRWQYTTDLVTLPDDSVVYQNVQIPSSSLANCARNTTFDQCANGSFTATIPSDWITSAGEHAFRFFHNGVEFMPMVDDANFISTYDNVRKLKFLPRCGAGTQFDAASGTCVCLPRFFNFVVGLDSITCSPCASWELCPGGGEGLRSFCEPGQQANDAQTSCVDCAPGRAGGGREDCLRCDSSSTVANTDRTSCDCKPGYYQLSEESICTRCADSFDAGSVACPGGHLAHVFPTSGYWIDSSAIVVTRHDVFPCATLDACPGWVDNNVENETNSCTAEDCCSAHYSGILCGTCLSNATDNFINSSGKCLRCPGTNWLFLLLAALGCVALSKFLYKKSTALDNKKDGSTVAILTFYAQSLALLKSGHFYGLSLWLDFDVNSGAQNDSVCRTTLTPFPALVMGMVGVPSFVVLVTFMLAQRDVGSIESAAAATVARQGIGESQHGDSNGQDTPASTFGLEHMTTVSGRARMRAVLEVFMFSYMGITKKALSVLFCRTVHDSSLVAVDLSVHCLESAHIGVILVALVVLIAVSVGLPAMIVRKALSEQRHDTEISEELLTFVRLTSLFHNQYNWWMAWLLVRRALLAATFLHGQLLGEEVHVFGASVNWRALAFLVLMVSALLQNVCEPFRIVGDNKLEQTSLLMLMLAVYADSVDTSADNSFSAAVVFCSALIVLITLLTAGVPVVEKTTMALSNAQPRQRLSTMAHRISGRSSEREEALFGDGDIVSAEDLREANPAAT